MAALLIVETRRTLELNFFNAARRHRPYAAWITVEAWARPLLAVAALVTFKVNAQMILLGYVVATAAGLVVFRRYVQRDASKCAIQGGTFERELEGGNSQLRLTSHPFGLSGLDQHIK